MARLAIKLDDGDLKHYAGLIRNAEIHSECRPGLLADLATTDKTSLVAAINEVRNIAINAAPALAWRRLRGEGTWQLNNGDNWPPGMWNNAATIGNLNVQVVLGMQGDEQLQITTSQPALRIHWSMCGRFMRVQGDPMQSIEVTVRYEVYDGSQWNTEMILWREKLLHGDAFAMACSFVHLLPPNQNLTRITINCDAAGAELNMSSGVGNYQVTITECNNP